MLAKGSSVEEILDFQSEALEMLLARYRSKSPPSPWFGAGASVSYGYPRWTSFLLDAPVDDRVKGQLQKSISRGKFEKAADQLYAAMGASAFEARFEATFLRNPARPTGKTLVTEGLRLVDSFAVTTNYEAVLLVEMQAAFGVSPKTIDVLGPTIADAPTGVDLAIWRMHGPSDNFEQRVLRTREYDVKYGKRSWIRSLFGEVAPLEKYLDSLFHGGILFLGCGLQTDRTMDAMLRWAKRAPPAQRSFALLEEPSPKDRASRLAFLSARHIQPIFFPQGDYKIIPDLLSHIADVAEPLLARRYREQLKGISIQSRLSLGEAARMASPNRPHLDLSPFFDGQRLKAGHTWDEVLVSTHDFLAAHPVDGETAVELSAHLSIAYHVGTAFPESSGKRTLMLQRIGGVTSSWTLNDNRCGNPWDIEVIHQGSGEEWAIVVDTKVQGTPQALEFLKSVPTVGHAIVVKPPKGEGFLKGGNHCLCITNQIVDEIKRQIPAGVYSRTKHLILAGPWSLAFSLGQRSMNIGKVQLYEFINADSTYEASFISVRK